MYFSATKLDSSFKIYISNDEVVESTEEFFLDLEIPSGAVATGVTKGSPDMAKVEIANDDGECCSIALYSNEHIVHFNKCLLKLTGSVIFHSLNWSPYPYDCYPPLLPMFT